jgi:hypothetical protein
MSAEAWVSANDETRDRHLINVTRYECLATDVPLHLAKLKHWFDPSLKKLRGRATQD